MKHALLVLALAPLACASSANAAPAPAAPAPAAPAPAAPAAPAPAAPAPSAPAGSPACAATGVALFEIDHRVEPGVKLPTSTIKVFGSGAWTHDATDAEGKALAPLAGCLAKPDLATLETTLKGAPWDSTIARVHCMAMSSTFTVYQVNGKKVFKETLCSERILDPKSRAALEAAVKLVEGAAKR